MIHLGIDPGVSGALAVLHPSGDIELFDVPTRKASRGSTYLAGTMADLLRPFVGSCCVLEEARPPMVARGVGSGNISSAFKIGYGYGLWEMALAALKISYEIVPASLWKKEFRLIGQDKPASRARACELWPELRGGLMVKRPDFSEALLLAEYSRRRRG
jgi:crossover junction endodeoxyribonuclease RuvC